MFNKVGRGEREHASPPSNRSRSYWPSCEGGPRENGEFNEGRLFREEVSSIGVKLRRGGGRRGQLGGPIGASAKGKGAHNSEG